MKRYRLTYYNSGGYRTTAELETAYTLRRREGSDIEVLDGERRIGDESLLEQLLTDQLGWAEERTVVAFERIEGA